MAKLIDAEALLLEIERVRQEFNTGYPRKSLSRKDTIGIINTAPTIDAVAVVRCRECKIKDTEDCPMSECVESTPSNGFVWKTDHKAQYCSYGKAKEGDDGK